MRKIIDLLMLIFLLIIALFGQKLAENLPAPRSEILRAQYEGYTGVIRLWTCEGWQSGHGSLIPWLNACITRFEKRHPGVYVQITEVTEDAMQNRHAEGINPPDMILFAPGMLDSAEQLIPIEDAAQLLCASLRDCGTWKGTPHAIPIAMGGYAWACDTQRIPALPQDWSETEFCMLAPEDSDYLSFSAALIALCCGTESAATIPQPGAGMDLGLPLLSATASPAPAAERIFSRLCPGMKQSERAFDAFLSKEANVIAATQREIRRLQIASEGGKGPDWTIYPAGDPFTDQLAMIAITKGDPGEEARIAAEKELLLHLLSEESQSALTKVRALRVTEGEALYSDQFGMAQLEAAYLGKPILVPNAFDTHRHREAQTIFSLFAEGRISPETACAKLREELSNGFARAH